MHRQPHLRRWVVSAIASWVHSRGHPPQDDWSYGCDGVWADPQKKHLHDRACAMECQNLASPPDSFAGRRSTIQALWWPSNWPCGCAVASCPGVKNRRLRTEKRSMRSEARLVATACSRRWTTLVVDWSNDTLLKHEQAMLLRVDWSRRERYKGR